MNLHDWAENEIKIACKERSNCNESDEYYKACCESALRAYNCLLDDGHSGMSWNITKNILMRLMDNKPLSPITGNDFESDPDIHESPEWLQELGIISDIPCTRMSGLYKYTYKDGTVRYKDVNRVTTYDEESNTPWNSGWVNKIVDDMYPITMPYMGEKYIAYVKESKSSNCKGDYDCAVFKTLKHPDGTIETINRFFVEDENGSWIEVDEPTYNKFIGGN